MRNAKLQEVEDVCHINDNMFTREKPSYEGQRHRLVCLKGVIVQTPLRQNGVSLKL